MSLYRDNAYRPPSPDPVPPWWRRLWEELRERVRAHVARAWCDAYGHNTARHTLALGWCVRCRAPLAWAPAKGLSRDPFAWEAIGINEWTQRHELSIACGFDKGCAQRMREEGMRN